MFKDNQTKDNLLDQIEINLNLVKENKINFIDLNKMYIQLQNE